jgi:hypothetical protein
VSYDDEERPRPRRETLMERRLRAARGEPVDDEVEYDDGYDREQVPRGYDRDYEPQGYGARVYGGPPRRGGGGCAQTTLYLVLGAIATLVILLFAGNAVLGRVGSAFGGVGRVAPTPTPEIVDRGVTVRQIQALSRLETTRYSLEIVETVQQDGTILGIDPPDILGGLVDDELLLIVRGNVVAGVDLSKLQADDVQISPDGESITVTLPPSEIFDAALDEQRTQVYSRERGLFAPENKDLETTARQRAQVRFLESACADGIMQQAAEQGQASVEQLLRLSGFSQVTVQTEAGPCELAGVPQNAPAPTTTP